MKESTLHSSCTNYLRRQGWRTVKLTTLGRYGTVGWPDILAIAPSGHVHFFELKVGNNDLTERQEETIRSLREDYHQSVTVVRSLNELKNYLGD